MSLAQVWFEQLMNGLVLGSFYALIALGYSMVYGIIKLLNFAHGDIYMWGSFVTLFIFGYASVVVGSGWAAVLLGMITAMIFMGLVAFFIQRFAYRPLFDAPRLSLLITAIGVSMILYNLMMVLTNGEYKFFNSDINVAAGIAIGPFTLTYVKLIMLIITAVLMISLSLFINRTIWGKAMRGIAQDKNTCRLMGINVNKIIGLTFFIGSALAAVAGCMACVYYGSLHYFMGYIMGIKAFTAAVIGGIGSIPGAMLGGILLGLLEAVGTQVIGSAWKDVFAFVILIIMLIFKPTGMMGKTEIERM